MIQWNNFQKIKRQWSVIDKLGGSIGSPLRRLWFRYRFLSSLSPPQIVLVIHLVRGYFWLFNFCLCISIRVSPTASLLSSSSSFYFLSPVLFTPLPLFLFKLELAFYGYQTTMVNQVAVRLGTSSSTEAGWGNSVGKMGPHNRQQGQRQSLLSLLGVSQENQVTQF